MRGKLYYAVSGTAAPRITPAHAGKTLSLSRQELESLDHPRACGENTDSSLSLIASKGSPPRMRGKHDCLVTSNT